ncbi:hypothetical protein B0H17DRAFT_1154822 [Mycena rosella]|uniref:Uncharacterized protein n=1 Tax=Mycena rosella TaxID=1033263 RepID=A0AAD7F5R0_MYCRO|nr:hypothetical protein B0H17DRAFT_1154822 [Mycena rosella]
MEREWIGSLGGRANGDEMDVQLQLRAGHGSLEHEPDEGRPGCAHNSKTKGQENGGSKRKLAEAVRVKRCLGNGYHFFLPDQNRSPAFTWAFCGRCKGRILEFELGVNMGVVRRRIARRCIRITDRLPNCILRNTKDSRDLDGGPSLHIHDSANGTSLAIEAADMMPLGVKNEPIDQWP